jgi:hypothetical protein
VAANGVPFELYLELLARDLPGGQELPAGGQDLPLVPLDLPALTGPSTEAGGQSSLTPAPLVAAGLHAGLRFTPAPTTAAPPAAVTTPVPVERSLDVAAAALAPLGGAVLAPVAADAAATEPVVPSMLADAAASATPTAPLDEVALPVDDALPPGAKAWLEGFAAREAPRVPPSAAGPTESRAAAPSIAPPAGVPPAAAPPLVVADRPGARAPAPPQASIAALRTMVLEGSSAPLAMGVADSTTLSGTEWLPSTPTPSAPSTATAPTVPLPSVPVDTRAPSWQEAFASRVQWLVDQHAGEARIKLNPPELGALDVKISLVEDKTYVHLTAATAAARDELSQSLPRLRELFSGSGLELGGASVQSGHDGRHATPDYGESAAADPPALASLLATLEDGVPARRARPASGRIDVFA